MAGWVELGELLRICMQHYIGADRGTLSEMVNEAIAEYPDARVN